MAQSTENTTQEPQFVKYLLDPEQEYDCYFLVGNKDYSEPERIGVVKKMLLAHSLVLRRQLQESQIKEKGVVQVNDLFPDTFKNLLRFVYGFDNTMTLSFDEADNLLYAAEKYEMLMLKARLATRLMELLSADNICSLMNNPACYTDLELNSAITHILQGETSRVLATPQFLDLTGTAFNRILEQEALSVPEIELWRAALKWAKHKTGSEDGPVLRKQLAEKTKHIRICTMSNDELIEEVFTAGIVSWEELQLICESRTKKEKPKRLLDFCNEIQPRKISTVMKGTIVEVNLKNHLQGFAFTHPLFARGLTLTTKNNALELMPLEFDSRDASNNILEGATYPCDCTIVISCITYNDDYDDDDASTEAPVIVVFRQQVAYNKQFVVPVISNGQNVILRPKNKYNISVTFTQKHRMYVSSNRPPFNNDHLSIEYCEDADDHYCSPIRILCYRPILEQ